MKVIAKPIDMVAWFTKEGIPNPVRFRLINEDQSFKVIKIDKIISVEKEKIAGNPMMVFTCKSMINSLERVYEIKYELSTCKWMLFKI